MLMTEEGNPRPWGLAGLGYTQQFIYVACKHQSREPHQPEDPRLRGTGM